MTDNVQIKMTSSVQINKKDNKYYIHLSWYVDGKRKQKCIGTGLLSTGNNKREVERIRRRVHSEWEQKLAENSSNILFSDYLVTWLDDVRHTIAEPTYVNYRSVLTGVICPYFAEKKVRLIDLTPHDIQAFYYQKMEKDGIKPNTIRHYQAYIHRALDYAVRMKLRKDNPADLVDLPRKEKHTANFLPPDGIRQLMAAANGTVIEPVVRLAIWFGLRRGEILGLKWSDINLESKTLYINNAVSKGETLLLKQPKTYSSIRRFALTDEMVHYFQSLRERQAANKSRFGNNYNDKFAAFVCVNERGEWLKPDYVSTHIPKLAEASGLPRIKLHELRHSSISLLLQNGASMKEAQLWAGHSNYSTTADIYAHVLPENTLKFSEAIQNALTE